MAWTGGDYAPRTRSIGHCIRRKRQGQSCPHSSLPNLLTKRRSPVGSLLRRRSLLYTSSRCDRTGESLVSGTLQDAFASPDRREGWEPLSTWWVTPKKIPRRQPVSLPPGVSKLYRKELHSLRFTPTFWRTCSRRPGVI